MVFGCFFFQAEDGIRDDLVTGVQTCALPICENDVAEQSRNFSEIAKECGGGDFTWTTRPEDRTKLWQARHDAYWAVKALRVGAGVVATDVCVPISRLADCVTETEADLERLNLQSPIVGHVGDGNFHCSLLCDVDDR